MLNLQVSALLISDGWEHISNMSSQSEAEEVLKQLELRGDAYEYTLGEPKGGVKYSSQLLKGMGMVGLYRRGGRTIPIHTLHTPFLPAFSDNSPTVVTPKQGSGGAYDKTPAPIFAGGIA